MKTAAEVRRANLNLLVQEFGKVEVVAERAETSAVYLSQIRNQAIDVKTGKPRQMGGSVARKLEKGCGKPTGWMDQDHTTSASNIEPGPELRGKVPLISWIRAGGWCEAADPFQPGDADQWLDCPVSHSSGTFALRVRGDSMTAPHGNTRTYPEGCIIFVDPERRNPVNGERIVACLEGPAHEVTFKVYKNEDGRQWLQPLNPSHEPIRESFRVLGTVLGKWEDG